jgi:C_GCAxxG_C_C family probable redox protein
MLREITDKTGKNQIIRKKMKSQDEIATRMIALSAKEYNCSQILMILALEQEEKENPDLVRSMSGLADGCGFFNETCGAMTSAASIFALYAGKGADDETESKNLLLMLQEYGDWFQKEIGGKFQGTRCKDIAGNLVGTPEVKQICGVVVFQSYNKANEILASYGYLSTQD